MCQGQCAWTLSGYKHGNIYKQETIPDYGPNGAVAKSLANGLVGSGFVSSLQLPVQSGVLKTQWVGVSEYRYKHGNKQQQQQFWINCTSGKCWAT